MNIFANAVKKMLPQLNDNAGPAKGSKDARISAGFAKIGAFVDRGIQLNPIPARPVKDRSGVKLCPNHEPKLKQPGRAFFRCGDLGYFNPGKPVPYSRKEVIKRGLK